MNKKISTRVGIVASMFILSINLFLISLKMHPQSPWQLLQFGVLLVAMVIAMAWLKKYYAGITMFDYFKHGIRTLATIMFIIIVGNSILYFVLAGKNEPLSNLTWMIMKTIFSYSASGVLSAFFTSFIFNTFTKK